MTHLHDNVHYPNLDTVRYYVTKGANVNCMNEQGYTPLHLAIMNIEDPKDRLATFKYLIEAGADPNIRNPDGYNILHLAVLEGDLVLVKLTHNGGADVDSQTTDYRLTSLHLAVGEENMPIIQYLVETAGADVNIKNAEGNTAFMEAQNQGNHEISRYLMEHGAELPQGVPIHLIVHQDENSTDMTGDSNSDIYWDDM